MRVCVIGAGSIGGFVAARMASAGDEVTVLARGATLAAIRTHDFVFVHVEALDEVSHAQDLRLKIKTIEEFDQRLIGRVLASVDPAVTLAVLPDHPVPVRTGKHTRTPVPVAVRRADWTPDGVQTYDEAACLQGALGALQGRGFMDLLFQ